MIRESIGKVRNMIIRSMGFILASEITIGTPNLRG
jgi:hypothetical protein